MCTKKLPPSDGNIVRVHRPARFVGDGKGDGMANFAAGEGKEEPTKKGERIGR